jgi:hypothetical protein
MVFYSVDRVNLLPVVCNTYYRGNYPYDEQGTPEKVPVLVPRAEKQELVGIAKNLKPGAQAPGL